MLTVSDGEVAIARTLETRFITFGAVCPAVVGVKGNDIARDWVMVVTRSQGISGDGFFDGFVEIDTIIAKPGMQYGWGIMVRELDCVNTGCT